MPRVLRVGADLRNLEALEVCDGRVQGKVELSRAEIGCQMHEQTLEEIRWWGKL